MSSVQTPLLVVETTKGPTVEHHKGNPKRAVPRLQIFLSLMSMKVRYVCHVYFVCCQTDAQITSQHAKNRSDKVDDLEI